MDVAHEILARAGQNSLGIRMGQDAPEWCPPLYSHRGPFTHTQGRAIEPVNWPGRATRKPTQSDVARAEPAWPKAPTPKNMGSRIPWRTSDDDGAAAREALNTFAGRPKSAKYACTAVGCDWWATKPESTLKHGRKPAPHRVVKV